MDNTNIGNLMDSTIGKMREIVNVDNVVGSPITTPDGVTVIPISRVSYGFATGGSDFHQKDVPTSNFAGGNGAGVRIEPIGFLIIRGDSVRLINVAPPPNTTVDRVIEKAPELVETIDELLKRYAKKGNAEE
ncbi:MAG: GerW family sporulation protein [Oscillospiraceae bacterium]|nr:GerW family sporulation protein [Oscillospiraceae bacterium]